MHSPKTTIPVIFVLLTVCGLLLIGCSRSGTSPTISAGSQDAPQPVTLAEFDLPLPDQLPAGDAPRTASFTEASIFEQGFANETELPHQNFTALSTTGEFDCEWTTGLTGSAYAIYRFGVADYDRAAELHYNWSLPPDPIGSAWIGLANFDTNRWDWFQCSADSNFPFTSIAPYTRSADDAMFAAVIVAGHSVSELLYLRLGPSPVNAVLTATPESGLAPLTVLFDASASTSDYGVISSYSWDFDGDGTDDLSGTESHAEHTYAEPGVYSPRLTIETSHLESATAELEIETSASWQHTWGGTEQDVINDIVIDGDAIYAIGNHRSFSTSPNEGVLMMRYDLEGNLEWVHGWNGSTRDLGLSVDVGEDGLVYATGVSFSYGAGEADVFVQAWSPAGEVLWSATWGSADADIGYDIRVMDDKLLVCGQTEGFKDSAGDALLLAYDLDGNLLWERAIGEGGESDILTSLDLLYDTDSNKIMLYAGGYSNAYEADAAVLCVTADEDGNLLETQSWFPGNSALGTRIHAYGTAADPELFICGYMEGATTSGFLVEVSDSPLAFSWTGPAATFALDFARRAGAFHVVGMESGAPDQSGFTAVFSNSGELQSYKLMSVPDEDVLFSSVEEFPGSGLIIGGFSPLFSASLAPAVATTDTPSANWVDRGTSAIYVPDSSVTSKPEIVAKELDGGEIDDISGSNKDEALLLTIP